MSVTLWLRTSQKITSGVLVLYLNTVEVWNLLAPTVEVLNDCWPVFFGEEPLVFFHIGHPFGLVGVGELEGDVASTSVPKYLVHSRRPQLFMLVLQMTP